MKSKELRTYHSTLAELNNSFTHYNFIWEQFRIDYLNDKGIEKDTRLTTDIFVKNIHVETHRISMNKLDVEHTKTKSTLYEGIFVLLFTYFENYLKGIMQFAIAVDNSIPNLDSNLLENKPDKILIDKIFNRIGIDKRKLDSEITATLDYYRLKRNRVIHKNSESISRSLRDIINSTGKNLNSYWNKRIPKSLQGVDFTSTINANVINWDILKDTINSLKGITFDIDKTIIAHLTKKRIFNQIVLPKYLSILKGKARSTNIEKLYGMFDRYSMAEFGLELDDELRSDIKSSIA